MHGTTKQAFYFFSLLYNRTKCMNYYNSILTNTVLITLFLQYVVPIVHRVEFVYKKQQNNLLNLPKCVLQNKKEHTSILHLLLGYHTKYYSHFVCSICIMHMERVWKLENPNIQVYKSAHPVLTYSEMHTNILVTPFTKHAVCILCLMEVCNNYQKWLQQQ